MNNLLCAVCGRNVPLDSDHVEIEVEKFRMEDRNDIDDYVLHDQCARSVFGSWTEPA